MAGGQTVALSNDLADRGAADPVGLGNLGQTHSAISVSKHSGPINVERLATDLAAFEPSSSHGPGPARRSGFVLARRWHR